MSGPGVNGGYPDGRSNTVSFVHGLMAGAGFGGWVSNATDHEQLRGRFNQVNLNTPFGSVSLQWSGSFADRSLVYQVSGAPPALGASVSAYPTTVENRTAGACISR